MAQHEQGFHIGWITVVVPLNNGLDAGNTCCARHITPQDGPTIAAQVVDELVDLGDELRSKGIVHQKDHLPPEISDGNLNARADVAGTCNSVGDAHDPVLVVDPNGNRIVRPLER